MGPHWALLARTGAPRRRARASVEGEPRRAQWHPVDLADWSTVGRPAGPLSVVSNLPPAVSAVVRGACCVASSKSSLRHSTTKAIWIYRKSSSMGASHPAKQGGARVGKTKRGKGSKIMAIADRQGLPVAVHVESATRTKSRWCTPHSRSGLSVNSRCASWRQRLRVRQTRQRTGAPWRGTDRATPANPDTADARRSSAASLPTTVEDRATLCLVPEVSADRRAL
jgi:hypothetical protein